jgi:ParB family transcriptional regulator, chromosome partitioning protein
MARRRLEVPSADELKKIEDGFARETSPTGLRPPIAHVAAEAAALSTPLAAPLRVQAARDAADADRYRRAEAEGLMVSEIALEAIYAEELARDRLHQVGEDMDELRASIRVHGLRLPIEVFELPEPRGAQLYGLISGWRRLNALRALHAETGDVVFAKVRAFVRRPENASAAYVAMVEENEIRADLSQYERGRIAALAAGEGVFPSVEAAVEALFYAGSKAKRSKIRSFAQIHEELGDLLNFAAALSERAGLRVAGALRVGMGERMRGALAAGQGDSAESEWKLLEPLVLEAESKGADPARGGRPRRGSSVPPKDGERMQLSKNISISCEQDKRGYLIRFHGDRVDAELVKVIAEGLQRQMTHE